VVHSKTAVALGISADAIAKVLSNPRNADIPLRMQPVLDFVGKLTRSPGKITSADIDPIFAAGWDDRAVHDATAICALFNFDEQAR
jgi:alkylhydroperoxidase family enzyme